MSPIGAILILALASPCSSGTTVVSIITPDGIVLGTDSKTVNTEMVAGEPRVKLVLIQNRLGVATAWLTSITDTRITDRHTGRVHTFEYEFQTWIRSIEKRLPADITVTRLSEIIENEAATTFKDFHLLVQTGRLQKDESRGDTLVRYYVVGYERAIPFLYKIEIQIDWQAKRLIGPKTVLIHPTQGADINWHFNVGGTHIAIDQILKREGEAYEKALSRVPDEITKLLGRKNLTLEEAVKLSIALIEIEAEANPQKVGRPIRVAVLPTSGNAKLTVYR